MSEIKTYGLIGYPIKHSLSPIIHNTAFKALGINAEYKLFEVKPQDLETFLLKTVYQEKISGFNITIPHKVQAKHIIDRLYSSQIKNQNPRDNYYIAYSEAINTVQVNGKISNYFNTDVGGFLISLKDDLGFEARGQNIFLLGCGGVGRAAIAALSWKEDKAKKIYVYESNLEAVKHLKSQYSTKVDFVEKSDFAAVVKDCSLLVNASPVGMDPADGLVIEEKYLHKDLLVYDVVYNRETELIKAAKSLGLKACNGLGMLLYQGIKAFTIWTGQDVPPKIITDIRVKLEQGVKK